MSLSSHTVHHVWFILVVGLVALTKSTQAQDWDRIKTDLESEYWSSLKLRKEISKSIEAHGSKSQQLDSLNLAIQINDSLALIKVADIIDAYGWPSKQQIGVTGSQTIFFTIQHADRATREKYRPMLEMSVAQGESEPHNLMLLTDRLLVEAGEPQRYGTQYYYSENGTRKFFYPIKDIKAANRWRKDAGLESLNKYARINKIEFAN